MEIYDFYNFFAYDFKKSDIFVTFMGTIEKWLFVGKSGKIVANTRSGDIKFP